MSCQNKAKRLQASEGLELYVSAHVPLVSQAAFQYSLSTTSWNYNQNRLDNLLGNTGASTYARDRCGTRPARGLVCVNAVGRGMIR